MTCLGCPLHLDCLCPTPGACPIVAAVHGEIERQRRPLPRDKGRGHPIQREAIPGDTYGAWTVLGELPRIAGSARRWSVRCVCGTETSVQMNSLLNGDSTRCTPCRLAGRNGGHAADNADRYGCLSPVRYASACGGGVRVGAGGGTW